MTTVLIVAAVLAACGAILRARRANAGEPLGGWHRIDRVGLSEPLVARVTPDDASLRLARAGVDGVSPQAIGRGRLVGAVIGLAVGPAFAVVWVPGLLASLPAALAGFAVPGAILARAERTRGAAITSRLPGALDLLAICVQGGLALDPALAALERHTDGPLADELSRLLRSISLGTPRRVAYRQFAERCPSEEVGALVAALRQSEELGAPLAPTLRTQAFGVREAARRAALERAATAAPRIQLVTALVLVPAAMLLIVATLLVQLGEQISTTIGGAG